jgi:hypothetical protein
MELKHNKYDIIVYIISFILICVLFIVSNAVTNKAKGEVLYAIVTIEGKQKYKLDMNEDVEIVLSPDKYSSLLGEMIIEIKDKKVRVKKEESPLHYCSMQGWVESVARPIVCLPNAVIITIMGQATPDNDWEM